jgi:hypothetical protein
MPLLEAFACVPLKKMLLLTSCDPGRQMDWERVQY